MQDLKGILEELIDHLLFPLRRQLVFKPALPPSSAVDESYEIKLNYPCNSAAYYFLRHGYLMM